MESEDSTHFNDSLGQDPTAPSLDVSKDLPVPSELEEPINLSVKKTPVVSVVNTSVALQQYQNLKGEAHVSNLLSYWPQTEQMAQQFQGRWREQPGSGLEGAVFTALLQN